MNFFRLFRKEDQVKNQKGSESLEKIFGHFTELLKENNETLELMADLEEKQGGHFLFDMSYLRSTASRIAEKVGLIVTHLIAIYPNRYEELKDKYSEIRIEVEKTLDKKKEIPRTDFTINLNRITVESLHQTGGKNAHLGEVKNVLGLPTPEGFAVTTFGYIHFLSHNNLQDRIVSLLNQSSIIDQKTLQETEEAIKSLILQARIPPDMEKILVNSANKIQAEGKPAVRTGLAKQCPS